MKKKQLPVVAFLPLRGGSKGIPGKNIRDFAGKPLCYWSIRAACDCRRVEKIYVATDSEKIRDVVLDFRFPKVEVIGRSEKSATDKASSELVLLEFAQKYESETIVFLQATSPLTTSADLDGALKKMSAGNLTSLVSGVNQKRFVWKTSKNGLIRPQNYDPRRRPRRQDWDGYFVENGAFYITKTKNLLKQKCRVSGKIGFWEMPEESYFEIDSETDWTILEGLFRQVSR